MPTDQDKINQLYKNYSGTAHTNKSGPFSVETIPAVNLIYSENIIIDSIPKTDISTITQLVYDHSWNDSSGINPSIYEGIDDTYSEIHPDENIEFYKNLELVPIPNSNNFAWYILDGSGENILENSIHFKYDSLNPTYLPIVRINDSDESMLSMPYEWVFDNQTGILQFYGSTPTPTANTVKISFYKYVGRMGLGNLEFSISGGTNTTVDSSAVIDLSTNFYSLQTQFFELSNQVGLRDASISTIFTDLTNLDNSMAHLFNFISDICNIEQVFDLYEISRDLISLKAHDSIVDISISSLVAHDSILDISIIDLYSDIRLIQTVAGLQQSNINSLDTSVNTIEDKVSELESHKSTINDTVTDLSNLVGLYDASISAVFTDISNLGDTVTDLSNLVGLQDASISAVFTDISNLGDTVKDLSNLVGLHDASISAVFTDISNLDTSVNYLYAIIETIEGISGVMDFYDISTNLILLQNHVIIADASISYLEEKTTALESHSDIIDTSIIDLYSDITLVQTVAGLQQSNINILDTKLDSSINDIKNLITTFANNTLNEFTYLNGVFATQANNMAILASNTGVEINHLNAIYMINNQQIKDLSNIVGGLKQQIIDLSNIVSSLL